ncbi:unnamed protein product [Closterium sp. NIES-65]|nr:unnamed protein product [Closterium sp. NIES-65]
MVVAAVQAIPMAVLLNFCCSHHLTGTKEVFVDMASGGVKHACGFNGVLQSIEGRGTVALQGEAGQRILIPDMLYVPGVWANLLSAGQLNDMGVKLQGDGDKMLLIATTWEVLGRARYIGRVFCTDLSHCSTMSLSKSTKVVALRTIASATKSTPDRWQARLAHVGVDSIQSSAKHDIATGVDIKPSTRPNLPCVSCVGGKLARHTFPDEGSDAEEALAVVHSDLCRPIRWHRRRPTRCQAHRAVYDREAGDRGAGADKAAAEVQSTVEQQTGESTGKMLAKEKLVDGPTRGEQLGDRPTLVDDDENVDDEGEMLAGEESTDSDVVEVPIEEPKLRCSGRTQKPSKQLIFNTCLPPAAFTTLLNDAEADVDLPELDPDMHADPEHRYDIATMTVKEALASWKGEAVKAAMDEEIRSLINNGTWELVKRPLGVNIMKNLWVLMTVEREKARLDVKTLTNVFGADYDETYSPVSTYVKLRIFLSIIAVLDLNLMQLDMKNAFLKSKLDQVLYMYQPDYYNGGTGRAGKEAVAAPAGLQYINKEQTGHILKTPVSVDAYAELTFDNEET